jgi:hypothetical protein
MAVNADEVLTPVQCDSGKELAHRPMIFYPGA